ncbi:MAG: hypothetical protein J6A80_00825 [Lachnospiraceae bacterium]|nr:hypothetical protein [Lachnospiraceae bacterium]
MSRVLLIIALCMFGLSGCFGEVLLASQNEEAVISNEGGDVSTLPEVSENSSEATGNVTSQGQQGSEQSSAGEESGLQTEQMIDAQLLVKYPDTNGWMEKCDTGDIPYLANAGYIDKSVRDGIFMVSTPEELASFVYYVNTVEEGQAQYMQLVNDIDLEGYEWAPMGWYDGEGTDMPFSGGIYGEGYTIRNMHIESNENYTGFISRGLYNGVWDLTLENAYVKGNISPAILTGQATRGWYENCHVSGEVYGDKAGSLLGSSSTYDIFDCTADVMVNGETFNFLTYNEKAISEIVIEEPIVIVLHDDYSVTRTAGPEYTNLGWQVKKDGIVVVERDSASATTYCYADQSPGTYSICLTAFVDGYYMPVSNVVEYTIE